MSENKDRQNKPKRPVGRPPLEMPAPIPDTPENIASAVLNTKPKKRANGDLSRKAKREIEPSVGIKVYNSLN